MAPITVRRPSLPVAIVASAAPVALWGWMHLGLFGGALMPLTYVLPLMVAVWVRRRWLLWSMAAACIALAMIEIFVVRNDGELPLGSHWPALLSRILNVIIAGVVIHAIINLRDRLELKHAAVSQTNAELQASNEELAAREEELTRQNEELNQQSEELAQQNEQIQAQSQELEQQSEELRAANEELARRESMLHTLLHATQSLAGKREVMGEISRAALQLMGGRAAAAAVVERQGGDLVVQAHAGFEPDGPAVDRWPLAHSLAALVMSSGRTGFIDDLSLRPDIQIPQPRRGQQMSSVLAAPLRVGGEFVGAVEMYARQPQKWTQEHFRLVEWVAAQCSVVLEILRLQRELNSAALFPAEDPNPVLRIGHDGLILYANAGSELCLRSWKCAVGRPVPPHLRQVVADVLASGASREMDTVCHDRIISIYLAPVVQQNYVNFYGRDVTERRQIEQQLLQAKSESEAANKAKDQFLAVLSHEMRTPLTPVVLSAESLENDESLPQRAREQIGMIRRNIEMEARLIDDLLDLTRIARGKLEMRCEMSDVHEAITHAMSVCCTEQVRQRGMRIETDLRAEFRHVWGDSARLQQVFWNVLNNALKFTPDGGGMTVRTFNRAWAVADAGSALVIEIADTGIGIEPELLPRLFNAFEQGGIGTMRKFGGLGLGLAISRAIVEMHGGKISASSDGTDRGASFRIELPVTSVAADAEAPAGLRPQRMPSGDGKARAADGRQVLLVEDHPDTARMLSRLLESSGFRVSTAHSFASAMELVDRDGQTIDLLISDLGLPDGTGLDLMRRLGARRRIKGIAISGYGTEDDVRKSREAGFAEHLTKPLKFELLQSAIERVMGQ